MFTWHYFCPFSFNSSMSLYFRCFSYKKHIVGFYIFIRVRNFCLRRLIHLNFLWLHKFRVIFSARFLFFSSNYSFHLSFLHSFAVVIFLFFVFLIYNPTQTQTHTHTYWFPMLLCYLYIISVIFTTIKKQNFFFNSMYILIFCFSLRNYK